MNLTTSDILALPDGPQKRAMVRALGLSNASPSFVADGSKLVVTLAGSRAVNPLNTRKHWRVDQKRAKAQLSETVAALTGKPMPSLPVTVRLVRMAPSVMDDDNLAASLKHYRDGVAKVYGTDDGDGDAYRWVPDQERSSTWGVRIEIEPARVPAAAEVRQ